MMERYAHNGITWIDLESPTSDEVRTLIEEYGIDPVVGEELLLPTLKPRIEAHPNFMYLILQFPALRHTHVEKAQEIDFIVGKDFLITTRYDTIDPLHKFSKVFEVHSVVGERVIGEHAGFLFYYILRKLYKSVDHEIESIRSGLENIEAQIFQGREREMVAALSDAGRNLLNLRQTIEPHRDILRSLEFEGRSFWGDPFLPYLRALTSEYYRVHNHIMRNTESLKELRETNNSLLYTKQNEVMKILTIMAFVTFPLSLFAGIFGMNTDSMPIVGHPQDFWIITGIMLAGTAVMFGYFKHKEWL